jgi:hypothetical protein
MPYIDIKNTININMKTINNQITIHNTLQSAERAYNKANSAHLLLAIGVYFVDRSKSAIIEWPKKYKLIKEK